MGNGCHRATSPVIMSTYTRSSLATGAHTHGTDSGGSPQAWPAGGKGGSPRIPPSPLRLPPRPPPRSGGGMPNRSSFRCPFDAGTIQQNAGQTGAFAPRPTLGMRRCSGLRQTERGSGGSRGERQDAGAPAAPLWLTPTSLLHPSPLRTPGTPGQPRRPPASESGVPAAWDLSTPVN